MDVDALIGHLKRTLTDFLASREADAAGCSTEGPANSVECEQYARAYGKWLKSNATQLHKHDGVNLYKTYKQTRRDPDIDFDCLFAAIEEYFDDESSRSGDALLPLPSSW